MYADSQMYEGFAYVEIVFRGPDVLADPASTYAADTWGKFLEDPNGRFKTSIFQKVPGLYKKEYIWAYYLTQRDGGMVSFSTYLLVSKSKPTGQRVMELAAAIQQELSAMTTDPGYFTEQRLPGAEGEAAGRAHPGTGDGQRADQPALLLVGVVEHRLLPRLRGQPGPDRPAGDRALAAGLAHRQAVDRSPCA